MGDFFEGAPRSRSGRSFAAFYQANFSIVVRILGRIGVNSADIPDIAEHVFLKIYKNWDNHEADGPDVSLETICRQQAANHYRLYRHRFEQPEPNVGEEVPSEEEDAQSQLERHEFDQIVKRILDGMNAQSRDLLIRHEFQRESIESIAKTLNMARNTASTRLEEAKRIFRLRAERMLGDKNAWMLAMPLAMQSHEFNAELSNDFVARARDQVWRGLARKLGFSDEGSSAVAVREADNEPPQSESRRRVGAVWLPWSKPLLGVLTKPAFLLGAGVLSGIAGASLWPHASPAIARRMPSLPVVVLEHEVAKEGAGSAMSYIATTVVKTAPLSAAIAPQLDNELRSLQRGRALVAQGKYADALAVLREHETNFPHSGHAAARSRYIALAEEGLRRQRASISAP